MERFDTVVIGGGLLGCATAWMLAREGASVLLAERDQINQHASGQNAGSLHFQLEYRMIERGVDAARRAAEAMPLHLAAASLWSGLAEELGEPLGVVQNGGLMLAQTPEQESLLVAKAEIERSWGLEVRMLDAAEAQRTAPYLSESVRAAAYCPLEGKADTRIAGPAFARAATRLGAQVRTRAEVTGFRRDGCEWLVTLREGRGGESRERTIQADAVVLAAGVWTTRLGDLMDAELPTIPLALQMTVTLQRPPFIPHLVQHAGARLSLKQAKDGNVLIGGGWPARLPTTADGDIDLDGRPSLIPASVLGNARAAIGVVPELGGLPVLRSWVGTTTVTPDQLPLVGPVPGHPGAFVATGGSAFTLGPSFAQVLVDLVQSRQPSIDLTAYDPQRYGGSVDVR